MRGGGGLQALSRRIKACDYPIMNNEHEPDPVHPAPRESKDEHVPQAGSPAMRQLRTVGQRRRDAELKLEQHLLAARHRNESHNEVL